MNSRTLSRELKVARYACQTYIIPEQNKSVLTGVSGGGARSLSGSRHDATVHFRRLGTPVD